MQSLPNDVPVSQDITTMVPHRGQMLLIDRLLNPAEKTAIGEKTFCSDHPMVCNGMPARSLLIEMMAQTLAALSGYQAKAKGKPPPMGMLVNIECATFHADVEADKPCQSHVEYTRSLSAFHFAKGKIVQDDRLIVEAEMRFYIAEEDDAAP